MNSLIAPSKELGFSNIFLDFLAGTNPARNFYPSDSIEKVAEQIDKHSYPREAMARILEEQNELFGASDITFENIRKLTDQKSLCVFTGQQAGLFGGPLLVVIKALAIVKCAAYYSEKLNRPVIPIFWIAGDDHDYEEVNHTYLLNKNSELEKVTYETVPEIENPTAELFFDNEEELARLKNQVKEILGETDFTSELYEILDKAYQSSDGYVTAFGKFMAAITKKTGLVFFSPGDPKAKQIAKKLFVNIVENQNQLHERLNNTNDAISSNGYHIQVEKKENSAHLFYNFNGRKPLLAENGSFSVGETKVSKDELLKKIEQSPELFSTDVMTRPVLQSFLFPVLSQKGGAAEIAYLAQIHELFPLFDIPVPYYRARPSMTVIEKRFEKIINEYDIKFGELAGDIEQLINRIMAVSFPDDLEKKFNDLRESVNAEINEFIQTTLKFDPTLEQFAEQSRGKVDYLLKGMEGKVFASHKRKSQETRDKIYRLWHSVYPNRNFQERALNVNYFLARYGLDFIDFIYDKIDCEQSAHQLIHLSEYKQ